MSKEVAKEKKTANGGAHENAFNQSGGELSEPYSCLSNPVE